MVQVIEIIRLCGGFKKMREGRLELPWIAPPAPQAGASTSFATRARSFARLRPAKRKKTELFINQFKVWKQDPFRGLVFSKFLQFLGGGQFSGKLLF
mgnify:CR=1 FL=1